MTKFSWCAAGPEGSIPDHDACPVVIGGPDGIACSCPCHTRVAPEQAFGLRENGRGRRVFAHPTASDRTTSTRLNRGAMG